jgi:hypothetical protein
MRQWVRLATTRSIVVRGLICSMIVGTVLIAINQGDVIWNGNLETRHAAKIGLTYVVPYIVSTVSSVGALRGNDSPDI